MADNILDAACQRESPQAAKRTRLDSYNEDSTSVPPSSLKTEMFEEPDHPYKVLEGLNRLRLNSVLCDVILCCEGQEFPCHRSVLASFSSYFEAMFTSGMKESTDEKVTMSGVEPQVIGLLVNYAYTAVLSISLANVQALLAASDLLDVTAVREACCDYMKTHIDVNNCVEFYCCAEDYSCEMLEEHSMDYILDNFSVIYQQEEFLSLSVERVTEILASDHLSVPKEDMVFEAAMLWLNKCPTHRQSFEKVLEQIRLPLISPSYLHTVVECLDVVKEHQGCQRFISEAKGERPYSNAAHPRRTAVIVMVGRKKVESFDPLTNQWKTLGQVPEFGLWGYAVVASGSSLYLAGGVINDDDSDDEEEEEKDNKEMWRYDFHHNSWSSMAPLNKSRSRFSLLMLDGYVFAVSGQGSKKSGLSFWEKYFPSDHSPNRRGSMKSEDSMERYDPNTNTWQLMESVGVAAYSDTEDSIYIPAAVVALHGLLYFIGHAPSPLKPNPPPTANYNPETSVWTDVAPMQILRDRPAVCTLNGKIYVAGGQHHNTENIGMGPDVIVENTMECYNPKTNQWTMCAPMQDRRYGSSMVAMDGKIYIVGGRDIVNGRIQCPKNIESYREETNMWETVGQASDPACLKCVSLRLRSDSGTMPQEVW